MARYTVTIEELINAHYDLNLRTYPIFDEKYRKVLNKKIIDHYYKREIGAETPGLFKFFLNRTMNEIMPYYNQLYSSVELFKQYDPFHDKDIQITDKRTTNGTSDQTGSGTSESSDLDVNSDTPQTMLSIGDIKNNTYASTASWDNANANTSTTNHLSVDNTEDYISHIVGTNGGKNYSQMLLDLRETFLNIDMMVIEDEELRKCFLLEYESGY